MLALKDYQQRTLQTLADYFRACRQYNSASLAFAAITEATTGQGRVYTPVRELPGLPYVCLRLPTGGGKTLVAAHSVALAAAEWLHTPRPLALWLTPSNAIRTQTLQALKDPGHPYRQALEARLGPLSVLDIGEALSVQPAAFLAGAVVVVATMQAFRVDDTEGRKVYEASGALMAHFSGLPAEAVQGLELLPDGQPKTSLANVLRLHRPVIVVDEAHNARTGLSFETLARFRPACILEYSATPDTTHNPSNVLHSVSAAELKAEGMIKLPVRLETQPDWRAVISAAVAARNQLEQIAGQERAQTGEYLRPLALFQAQPRHGDNLLTVETLKAHLLQEQRIPENQIALATGNYRELEGVDLSAPTCPVRYVITIQALREGWDCPFAYVLCTLAEQVSPTAVEQILGRILRLPQARSKQHPELNRAYAFAASANFAETARGLEDALVQNGFERQEARGLVVAAPGPQPADFGPLFHLPAAPPAPPNSASIVVAQAPELADLTPETAGKLAFDLATHTLTIRERLEPYEVQAVKACFSDPWTQLAVENAALKLGPAAATRPPLAVPLLVVAQGDFFEPFDESHFLDHPWDLAGQSAYLSASEYASQAAPGEAGEIDLDASGHLRTTFSGQLQTQMAALAPEQGWSALELAGWLDRNIPHIDLPYQQSLSFFLSLVERLIAERGLALPELVRDRYRLKQAAATKVAEYRQVARKQAYQRFLLPEAASSLSVSPEICFTYDPDPMNYPCPPPPASLYPGQHAFQKHYYPAVGDLKPQGEEYQCAMFLDHRPEVAAWVRNLERRPQHSFWLQTSSDRFYPDFVCRLTDGRYLVVEYKGEHLWDAPDAREKLAIGKRWEALSQGQCRFVMPKGPDFAAIQASL